MKTILKSNHLDIMISSFGAEISSVKNKEGLEFIWQANKEVWPRHAPVLFPVVGKLKGNKFIFEDIPYELGQHGFARDREFELIHENADSCVFQLKSDEQSKKIYPFGFIFQISYKLRESTLITDYRVINLSPQDLLFSLGAHPGFNCPLSPEEKYEDYYLKFENANYELTSLNDGLRTNEKKPLFLKDKKLFLSKHLFESDALVFENKQISEISLHSVKSAHKITLK
jgi:galactose mutarotase-like enzyme